MALQLLEDGIRKMKTADIYSVMLRWSFLTSDDRKNLKCNVFSSDMKRTKRWIAEKITEFCEEKGGLTMEHVAEMDLLCIHFYSSKRQWKAYQLTNKLITYSEEKEDKTPEGVQKKLLKLLHLYFSKSSGVHVQLLDGLLWVRVYLPQPGVTVYQSSRCLYLIQYPQTPLLLASGLKTTWQKSLQQCLLVAFGYREMTEMCLTGHNHTALAQLALNKFSQGGLIKYGVHNQPGVVKPKKRKALEQIHNDNICDEDVPAKRQRLKDLDKAFGENVLPALEKLQFRLELRYRSKRQQRHPALVGELCKGSVVFKGKNVLEGIRELAARGYTKCPLPKHLTSVPTRARNFFKLADSRRNTSLTHG